MTRVLVTAAIVPLPAADPREGYEIVANVGDQVSDLAGGFADRTFKLLPNPSFLLSARVHGDKRARRVRKLDPPINLADLRRDRVCAPHDWQVSGQNAVRFAGASGAGATGREPATSGVTLLASPASDRNQPGRR